MPTVTPVAPTRRTGLGSPLRGAALADFVAGLAGASELWHGFIPLLGPERASVHLFENQALDVWLIGWPEGTQVEPHDHGPSAGAFTVVRGRLEEVRWSPRRTSRTVAPGQVVSVAAGIVHDVVAGPGDPASRALSIHAYAPPLRSMGFYADDGTTRLTQVAVDFEPTVR